MKFEIETIYYGFTLKEETFIKEINSMGRLFYHEKSGARLFHLDNDDDNKVFSICFKTLSENNKGLPHIMEHSVLCGSRKYPAKDTFAELSKGSVNSFLNASTADDRTSYPVASRNEKDFFNLMDVYLDLTLYPNIYDKPETFLQQGWHYELPDPDGEITYKGVVYNEMKGIFSDPDELLLLKTRESLFPDTSYQFDSGGIPEVIPELTKEEFLDFHRKYYHPSNSYIYIYGNGDLFEKLKYIDEKYLQDFEKSEKDLNIPMQKPFLSPREVEYTYPISMSESVEDRTYLSLNFVVGRLTDPEVYLTFNVLKFILLDASGAPIKTALIESGIGKDVYGEFFGYMYQPIFRIVMVNSNESEKEKFRKLIFQTLTNIVEDGIDKKLIEAAINKVEFELREADYGSTPKGIIYLRDVLNSWLYGGNPTSHLEYEPTLEKIKSALKTDYLERFIQEYFLENNHCSLVVLKPERGLAEKKEKEMYQKLAEYKANLSREEINRLVEDNLRLKEIQETPDSREILDKIPMLSISDLSQRAERIPLIEKIKDGVTHLIHPVFTNQVAYISLLFDARTVDQELLPYLGLLAKVMGQLSTNKYNYSTLSNEINIHTGGIDFDVETYTYRDDPEVYYPKFRVRSRVLIHKAINLFELLSELICHTRVNDRKRLKKIIQQSRSRIEKDFYDQGHDVAANRLYSYFSSEGKYMDIIRDLSFYKFVSDLEKNFDEQFEEIIDSLNKVMQLIFNKENLILSITTEEENYVQLQDHISYFSNQLNHQKLKIQNYHFDKQAQNEGLLSPSEVQYVASAYNFFQLGYHYTGSLRVLKTIAATNYLWEKIRIQGGAYTGIARVDRKGIMTFISYRDPNLVETLSVFDQAGDYFKNFTVSQKEMSRYIIGTIGELDVPLTPQMRGERATANYISKVTPDDIQREREEIFQTTVEDIQRLGNLVSDVVKQKNFCVLGNEGKIKENKEVFKKLVYLFE